MDPTSILDNRSVAEATFVTTEKSLKLINEMDDQNAAKKLTRKMTDLKMYNSVWFVWFEEREIYLHRFLRRDMQDEEIGEYDIKRVHIGD